MSLYQKYRPQKFSDLVGEDHVRDTLISAIAENRVGHAYLFSGPRGTGKTSVARLLAKSMNCQNRKPKESEPCGACDSCKEIIAGRSLDIIEIDAASNRGIDEIRELREKIKFAPSSGKYKVFIIDEVHMLTLPAFNALLKTLEEPPAHAIFILATTEAHKIPATILSRVQRFDFRRINKAEIVKNLRKIIKEEGIKATDESLEALAVAAEGSHRDSISLLEQVSSLTRDLKLDDVRHVLGLARSEEILNLIKSIFSSDVEEALKVSGELTSSGVEVSQIVKEVIEILRQLLIYKISESKINFEVTREREGQLADISKLKTAQEINEILGIFIESAQRVKETTVRSLPLEMAIVESALPEKRDNVSENHQAAEKTEKGKVFEEEPKLKDKPLKTEEKEDKTDDKKVEKAEVKEDTNNRVPAGEFSESDWEKLLAAMKEENHSLSALLRDAYPGGVDGESLIVNVKFKFHLDKISENRNCRVIEDALEKITGNKYRLVCQIAERKSKKKSGSGADLEKAATEIFESEE